MRGLSLWSPATFLCLVFVLVAPSLSAQKKITEPYPDGKPHRVYAVDEYGQKDGLFEQFAASGKVELRIHFSSEQLHGRYESFHPDGSKKVVAMYSRDHLNGLWREFAVGGTETESKTYRNDVLHGESRSFYPDGKLKLVAFYRDGELHGRYQQLSADQSWTRDAEYKAGKLDGKVTIKRGRKVISEQRWVAGEIVDLDGIRTFPRSEADLREGIAAILAGQKPAAAVPVPPRKGTDPEVAAADPKAEARAAALRRLQAYRYLCGLPYREMALKPEWNDLCDAAAEVCQAIGRLSHKPPRPPGFDAARFAQGSRGAGRSNLSSGGGMARSVDSYMNDSDPSNIDRIGHRRWCLNPAMKFTGFGSSGRFSAMWSMDASGSGARGLDAVLYPPPGKVPVDFFGSGHAWSIATLRGTAPQKAGLKVTIHALDSYYQAVGEPLTLNHLAVAGGGYGGGPCIVFRPAQLNVSPEARYRVRVSLDGGKTTAFRYLVEFCAGIGD